MKIQMMTVTAVVSLVLAACGGEATSTGGGQGGNAGGAGGTGGHAGSSTTTTSATTTSTGGTGGEGGATPDVCPTEDPPGCKMDDPLTAYHPSANVSGAFGPIAPWENAGGSISCFGPFTAGKTFTKALVGLSVDPDPQSTMPLDVWVQDGPDATGHTFEWVDRPLESTEPGPEGLVMGVYTVPPVVGPGYVCVSAPLASYWPFEVQVVDCEVAALAQWLGLPWHDADGDGLTTTDELTVAPLSCPKDTTTEDGTPSVSTFNVHLPYAIRP